MNYDDVRTRNSLCKILPHFTRHAVLHLSQLHFMQRTGAVLSCAEPEWELLAALRRWRCCDDASRAFSPVTHGRMRAF